MPYTDYYDGVIAIIIESGLVYTLGLIAELVLSVMNSQGLLVLIGILSQTSVSPVHPFSTISFPSLRILLLYLFASCRGWYPP